jgi:hypothetical protein
MAKPLNLMILPLNSFAIGFYPLAAFNLLGEFFKGDQYEKSFTFYSAYRYSQRPPFCAATYPAREIRAQFGLCQISQ